LCVSLLVRCDAWKKKVHLKILKIYYLT